MSPLAGIDKNRKAQVRLKVDVPVTSMTDAQPLTGATFTICPSIETELRKQLSNERIPLKMIWGCRARSKEKC